MASFIHKHRSVLAFFAKLLAVYVLWYVLYDLWLLPNGRVDRAVAHNVAGISGGLLQIFGFEAFVDGRVVAMPGVAGVEIADGCNGIAPIGLFIGFVLAFPGRWTRRLLFVPLGILIVYLTNIGRVVVMALCQLYWPAGFTIMHGFAMTTIFYFVVFGLWMLWANYGDGRAPAML